jgi:hypothetical protein
MLAVHIDLDRADVDSGLETSHSRYQTDCIEGWKRLPADYYWFLAALDPTWRSWISREKRRKLDEENDNLMRETRELIRSAEDFIVKILKS